jgi:hypothetical protein
MSCLCGDCLQDYAACKWPQGFSGADQLGSADTAAWFDAANQQLQQPGWSRLQQALQGRLNSLHWAPRCGGCWCGCCSL